MPPGLLCLLRKGQGHTGSKPTTGDFPELSSVVGSSLRANLHCEQGLQGSVLARGPVKNSRPSPAQGTT